MSMLHVHPKLSAGFALVCVIAAVAAPARAVPGDDDLGGRLTGVVDGREILLPVLHTDIDVDVQGDVAAVTVTQVFENPTTVAMNATYLFPLNKDAAVHAMTMAVGDEIVTAVIQEKEEARATFETAQREGRAAALLTQHRPNMFTQEIANLMPELPVTVTLKYVQTVPREDGAYELVVPMIVGPRYQPAPAAETGLMAAAYELTADGDYVEADAGAEPADGWTFGPAPEYPEVAGLTIPDAIERDRVSIDVALSAGMPIASITSATHVITDDGDADQRRVSLAEGRTIDNKDFVLRYQLAANDVQAGVLTRREADGGYFSLLIEPPADAAGDQIAAREIVFVLDTSGSMNGLPVDASKTFMREALRNLRQTDYFRIVQFSSTPAEFSAGPVPATRDNINAGLRFVNGMRAGGGTEVVPAIHQAFGAPQQPDTLRLVVFLSDGYIGNEAQVIREVGRLRGEARVYAFGIGSSVNRYLLSEMSRRGQGFARVIDPTEDAMAAARELAKRLEAPVLTDIAIDWGDLVARDVTPDVIPDLFEGGSLRLLGRFEGAGEKTVTLTGRVNGREARLPIRVSLPAAPAADADGEAIPLIWARSRIADAMRDLVSPEELRVSGRDDDEIRRDVTDMGLRHSLITQWTSFVAVSKTVVNAAPETARDASVPLPMVEGVTGAAYGNAPQAPGDQHAALQFAGSSAPEPAVYLALLGMLTAGLLGLRRRLRRRAPEPASA